MNAGAALSSLSIKTNNSRSLCIHVSHTGEDVQGQFHVTIWSAPAEDLLIARLLVE
jgi:hypothetical protein